MREFQGAVQDFQNQIEKWQRDYPQWKEQIVFNEDLINLNPQEVRFILVGDNPGKEEQKAHRYLIGNAGKGARRFFESTARLVDSFDVQVMVLNKTPVFTPATLDLGALTEIQELLVESQEYMAKLMIRFQKIVDCPLWITGFGGCRNAQGKWNLKPAKTRPLAVFFQSLRQEAQQKGSDLNKVGFFKHFSYANFQRDVHKDGIPENPEMYWEKLEQIGSLYRDGFFKEDQF